MSFVEILILIVLIVPIVALCIAFVLCAGIMQIHEEENRRRSTVSDEGQLTMQQRSAYVKCVGKRRYVRTAGALARAVG